MVTVMSILSTSAVWALDASAFAENSKLAEGR